MDNPDYSDRPPRPPERELAPLYWIIGRLTGGVLISAEDPDDLIRSLIPGYTITDGTTGAQRAQRRHRETAIREITTRAQETVNAKLSATGAFRRLPAAVRDELERPKDEQPSDIVVVWETAWPLLLLCSDMVPAELRRRKHPSVMVLSGRTDKSFLVSLRAVGMVSEWGTL